jgi:hypothetical protein
MLNSIYKILMIQLESGGLATGAAKATAGGAGMPDRQPNRTATRRRSEASS